MDNQTGVDPKAEDKVKKATLSAHTVDDIEFKEGSKSFTETADIKKSLYNAGYISEYSTYSSMELFAEAIADYYATKNRNETNKKKKRKAFVEEKYNPLSKAIFDITQELFHDEKKREKFKERHGY